MPLNPNSAKDFVDDYPRKAQRFFISIINARAFILSYRFRDVPSLPHRGHLGGRVA